MKAITTAEFEKILKIVEDALKNHSNWHDDLLRRLLCRMPLPESMVARDAHHHCAFGSWFYGMGKTHVETLPAFKKIGELHKTMHNSAREVCQKVKATGYVPDVDYDLFERDLQHFRNELNSFKNRVVQTLHNASGPKGL